MSSRLGFRLSRSGIAILDGAYSAAIIIKNAFQSSTAFLTTVMVRLITLPYYRFYAFNTLDPFLRIATSLSTPSPDSTDIVIRQLYRWRHRKLAELQFISIACAVLSAAVIGSFSWTVISDAYWLALAFWYSSLLLSILGILLSAQQIAVLSLLGEIPVHSSEKSVKDATVRRYAPLMLSERKASVKDGERGMRRKWTPKRKMVFTWQCPVMFMSYSVCSYLLGLTILVCSPLIQGGEWSVDHTIAIVYLAVAGLCAVAFTSCSFWIYHYVDLEHESEDLDDVPVMIRPATLVDPLAMKTEERRH